MKKRFLFLWLPAALLAVPGLCRAERTSSYDELYEKIQESFLKEDYAGANRLSEIYLTRDGRSPAAERVLYLQALSLVKLDRGDAARAKLARLENSASTPEQRARAAVSAGDSYYYEGQGAAAYASYAETLRRYPDCEEAPHVLSRLALIAGEEGKAPPEPRRAPRPYALNQIAVEETPFYSVQVGAFSKQGNAGVLLRQLLRSKYDAYLEESLADRQYRVRVGKLPSREAAEGLEARLKKDGYPTKICP